MTAVQALSPLRVIPAPGPKLRPTPLPGQDFPAHLYHPGYVQEHLDFDATDPDQNPDSIWEAPRTPPAPPDPEQIVPPLATALVEVLAGRRPVVQLVRWTSPEVYAALTARAAVTFRRGLGSTRGATRVVVRRIVTSRPQEEVVEVSLVVIDGARVRAIALQLRVRSGRWTVEALQVG